MIRELIRAEQSFQSPLDKDTLDLIRPLDAKYVYNREIKDYIIEKILTDLSEAEKSNLDRVIYIARNLLRNERRLEKRKQMLEEGWILLKQNIIQQAFKNNQRLQLKGVETVDWLTMNVEGIFKPFVAKDGVCFIMKPKASKKGYMINDAMLDAEQKDIFCKIVYPIKSDKERKV